MRAMSWREMQVLAMRFSEDPAVEPAPIAVDGSVADTEPLRTTR